MWSQTIKRKRRVMLRTIMTSIIFSLDAAPFQPAPFDFERFQFFMRNIQPSFPFPDTPGILSPVFVNRSEPIVIIAHYYQQLYPKWAPQLQTRSSAWVHIFGKIGHVEAQRLCLAPALRIGSRLSSASNLICPPSVLFSVHKFCHF